jgi:hypothetical protein
VEHGESQWTEAIAAQLARLEHGEEPELARALPDPASQFRRGLVLVGEAACALDGKKLVIDEGAQASTQIVQGRGNRLAPQHVPARYPSLVPPTRTTTPA